MPEPEERGVSSILTPPTAGSYSLISILNKACFYLRSYNIVYKNKEVMLMGKRKSSKVEVNGDVKLGNNFVVFEPFDINKVKDVPAMSNVGTKTMFQEWYDDLPKLLKNKSKYTTGCIFPERRRR
jgi:hypothetical protein